MLKLENAATFCFPRKIYICNMHKALFDAAYHICNIKVTIFVGNTLIADEKCHSIELKL